MSMDSIKLGILCKRWQWSDDSNYFYCHLLKANNKIKTCPDNYCAYETPQKVTNQMRTVIYKVVFLEKILKWSIKQNFSFFCSLLVYIIKFILIYMQLIVLLHKSGYKEAQKCIIQNNKWYEPPPPQKNLCFLRNFSIITISCM